VNINGGDFTISSADDAIHSNDGIIINDGIFDISSGDDGIHADASLEISGGDISITKSYEGIESVSITIDDGNVYLVSSDDGLNVAGDSSSGGSSGYMFYMNGGYLAVYSRGDGLDVNGSVEMSDGVVLVHGPTSDGNGPLDYDRSFTITGGILVAAGSSGMAQAPSTSSTQYSVLLGFDARNAGTLFHVETEGGTEILTFSPSKRYESIVFSTPELRNGTTYDAYFAGSSTGSETDGLYEGGSYSPGSLYKTFTISSTVTNDTGNHSNPGGRP
jgi:hypothetical protein